MLKVRVMPTLLFKSVGLVKGIGFDSWRRVGSAMQAIKVYNMREVDELVFLDIAATPEGKPPDFEAIDELADECFMPLTVGGGIRSVEDVRRLLQVGADKVAVNSAALARPELVREVSQSFGAQCIVVSIDVTRGAHGKPEVVGTCGTRPTGRDPVEWAKQVAGLGAGEILLTSVERDGTMTGYDLEVLRAVAGAVTIPVIASGGAGSAAHLVEAVKAGAAAVAAASLFTFTEVTPLELKRELDQAGIRVRI